MQGEMARVRSAGWWELVLEVNLGEHISGYPMRSEFGHSLPDYPKRVEPDFAPHQLHGMPRARTSLQGRRNIQHPSLRGKVVRYSE